MHRLLYWQELTISSMDYPVFKPSNMTCLPRRKNNLIKFLQPIRVITIITLLSICPALSMPWESATLLMYGFFPIFAASYVFEARFNPYGLVAGLKTLYLKYTQKLPLEFVGVAVFAILSFSTDPNVILHWGILTSAIVIGCGEGIEAYHKHIVPRLNKLKVSDRSQILAFIGAVVLFIFVWIYSFLEVLQHIS